MKDRDTGPSGPTDAEEQPLALDDIEIVGIEEHGPRDSVKLWGPPGTGKTTQAAARLGRALAEDDDLRVGDCTWITYRKSLATDTIQRLVRWGLLDERELSKPTKGETRFIGTAHAVANRSGIEIGEVVQKHDLQKFCEEELGVDYLRSPKDDPWETTAGAAIFDVLTYCAKNCIPPKDAYTTQRYRAVRDDLPRYIQPERFIGIAQQWEDWKREHGKNDFHEMLEKATEAAKEGHHPPLKVLVVDEYHDAYPLLDKYCRALMEHAETVIVAGDPLQVVNAYDGASPKFFQNLPYPEVLLPKSWRVPPEIWARGAKCLLDGRMTPPDITPADRSGRVLDLHDHDTTFVENPYTGDWIAAETATRPRAVVNDYGDGTVLFLARTKRQVDAVCTDLKEAGILFATQNALDGWNSTDHKYQRRRVPLFNALQKLRRFTPEQFETQRSYGLGKFTDADTAHANPEAVILTPEEARNIYECSRAKCFTLSRSEMDEAAKDHSEQEIPLSVADLAGDVKGEFWETYTAGPAAVDDLVNLGANSDETQTMLRSALKRTTETVNPSKLPVKAMTIHASKGSEAETVVLYDGISRRVDEGMHESEEMRRNEHRLWYVGCTRASERLIIARNAFKWNRPFAPVSGANTRSNEEQETTP